eukprot:scaffold65528_cov69-Attheya_sp.AAC.2
MALNPESGAIRQQWNIVFDDWFATVTSTSLPDFNSPAWAELFGDSIFLSPCDEDTDEQPETPPLRLAAEDARQEAVVTAIERLHPPQPLPVVPPPTVPQASSPTIPLPLATAPPSSFQRETSVNRGRHLFLLRLSHLNLMLRCAEGANTKSSGISKRSCCTPTHFFSTSHSNIKSSPSHASIASRRASHGSASPG